MKSWLELASSDGTPLNSSKVSLIVGTVLTAINQGDLIRAGGRPPVWKVVLTYCVPFCVPTYGAVSAKIQFEAGRDD